VAILLCNVLLPLVVGEVVGHKTGSAVTIHHVVVKGCILDLLGVHSNACSNSDGEAVTCLKDVSLDSGENGKLKVVVSSEVLATLGDGSVPIKHVLGKSLSSAVAVEVVGDLKGNCIGIEVTLGDLTAYSLGLINVRVEASVGIECSSAKSAVAALTDTVRAIGVTVVKVVEVLNGNLTFKGSTNGSGLEEVVELLLLLGKLSSLSALTIDLFPIRNDSRSPVRLNDFESE